MATKPPIKIVAVNGRNNDYARCIGPTEWTNKQVYLSCDKLPSNLKHRLLPLATALSRRTNASIAHTGGNQWAQSLDICAVSQPTKDADIALSLTARDHMKHRLLPLPARL